MITPGTWCVVELMGHNQHIGPVDEVEVFGAKMGRVIDLQRDGTSKTVIFRAESVYRITETTEGVARTLRAPHVHRDALAWHDVTPEEGEFNGIILDPEDEDLDDALTSTDSGEPQPGPRMATEADPSPTEIAPPNSKCTRCRRDVSGEICKAWPDPFDDDDYPRTLYDCHPDCATAKAAFEAGIRPCPGCGLVTVDPAEGMCAKCCMGIGFEEDPAHA